MEEIRNSIHCRATCTYWLGLRTQLQMGYVAVAHKTPPALCGKRMTNEYRTFQFRDNCKNWSKWSVLK